MLVRPVRQWLGRLLLRGVIALGLCLAARPAAAQEPEGEILVRRMSFAERGKSLVLTASFTEIFDTAAFAKLSSGFPTTVVARVYTYRKSRTDAPVFVSVLELEVVYDLWDEIYVVRSRTPLGERKLRMRSRAQAVRALTELDQMPIAPLDRIEVGPHHFVAMAVELNPVSPELLAEIGGWLTRPAGETAIDAGSSFFGSFVSIFVNPKLEGADRTLRVRSQPFYRTPR